MKYLKLILIIINISLIGLQLVVANFRAADGTAVAKVNKQIADLEKQNLQLQTEIYTKSSLSYIAEQARSTELTKLSTTTLSPLPIAAVHQLAPNP